MAAIKNFAVFAPLSFAHGAVNVLVFGDSFGDTGPTYHQVQDMFDTRGVSAVVKSSAVGGTAACQWNATSLADEAAQLFPDAPDGPDYVWYTMGANDQWQDSTFQSCQKSANNWDEMQVCTQAMVDKVSACASGHLDNFWAKYPKSKVMQSGYDVPCFSTICQVSFDSAFYSGFCGNNITCNIEMGVAMQEKYITQGLSVKYPQPQYTGLNLIGTVQKAAGIAGADVGKPVFDQGARCDWTTWCVHPKYDSPAGKAWGDAFWDLYFSKEVSVDSDVAV